MEDFRDELQELKELIDSEQEQVDYLKQNITKEKLSKAFKYDIEAGNYLTKFKMVIKKIERSNNLTSEILSNLEADNLIEGVSKFERLKNQRIEAERELETISEKLNDQKISDSIKSIAKIEMKIDQIEVDLGSDREKLRNMAESEISKRPKIVFTESSLYKFIKHIAETTKENSGMEAGGFFKYERREDGLLLSDYIKKSNETSVSGRLDLPEETKEKLKNASEERLILAHSHPELHGYCSHSGEYGDITEMEERKNKMGILACIESSKNVFLVAQIVPWPSPKERRYKNLFIEVEDSKESIEIESARVNEMMKSAISNVPNYNQSIIDALIKNDEEDWCSYL